MDNPLIQLVCAVLVFVVLYWVINLVCSLPGPGPASPPGPASSRQTLRIVLLLILALFALSFLLGEAGMWGTWGYGYHFHR